MGDDVTQKRRIQPVLVKSMDEMMEDINSRDNNNNNNPIYLVGRNNQYPVEYRECENCKTRYDQVNDAFALADMGTPAYLGYCIICCGKEDRERKARGMPPADFPRFPYLEYITKYGEEEFPPNYEQWETYEKNKEYLKNVYKDMVSKSGMEITNDNGGESSSIKTSELETKKRKLG